MSCLAPSASLFVSWLLLAVNGLRLTDGLPISGRIVPCMSCTSLEATTLASLSPLPGGTHACVFCGREAEHPSRKSRNTSHFSKALGLSLAGTPPQPSILPEFDVGILLVFLTGWQSNGHASKVPEQDCSRWTTADQSTFICAKRATGLLRHGQVIPVVLWTRYPGFTGYSAQG